MQTTAAGAAAATGSALLAGPAQASKPKKPNLDPDVILENGRIHTMDEHGTVASSVTIKDGRFMDVGRGAASAGRGTTHHRPARPHRRCRASSTTTTTSC